MNAYAVADSLGARPSGPGRWMARCPAHDDHLPSLSIAEGDAGRVLMHCWTGCDTSAVLAAAGLTWADIGGAPTSTEDRARLRRERHRRQAAEAVERQQRRATADLLRDLDARLDRLAPLATVDGAAGDAAAIEYHSWLDLQRIAEGVDPWAA